jgi:DNA-binding MarR family transcriptional regulator
MTELPCICIALRKASRRMTARYDEALLPAGITLAQFSLLKTTNRHAPVSLTRLSELTELDRSTLGRNVRVLERLGLVLMSDADDHREAAISLTPAGTDTLERALPLWREAQHRISDQLGDNGRQQLEALLVAL